LISGEVETVLSVLEARTSKKKCNERNGGGKREKFCEGS